MSDRFTRISVPLSRDEYAALFGAAEREYRHPRDQARAILRAALLRDPPDPATKNEGHADRLDNPGAPLPVNPTHP